MKKVIKIFILIIVILSTGCKNSNIVEHDIKKEKTEVDLDYYEDELNQNNPLVAYSSFKDFNIDDSNKIKVVYEEKRLDENENIKNNYRMRYVLVRGYDQNSKKIWEYKTDFYSEKDTEVDIDEYFNEYYIDDENQLIIICIGGNLTALNIKNGKIVWKNNQYGTIGHYSYSDKENRLLYVSDTKIHLAVIDITDGKTLYLLKDNFGLGQDANKTYEQIVSCDNDENFLLYDYDSDYVIDFNIKDFSIKVNKKGGNVYEKDN